MRSNLRVLAAQKSQQERRRISLRTVAEETTINPYTVYGIANDTIREYPKEVIEKLCSYFDCELNDLLKLVEEPVEGGAVNG